MDLTSTAMEIFRFFELTLPYIFLGFLIANLIKVSKYFRLLGLPMAGITRAAKLPPLCASSLSMFLFNSWSAMGMMADHFKEKAVEDRQVLVMILVANLPKSINSIVFFLAPVSLSVFGLWAGGALISIEFGLCLAIGLAGIIIGRFLFGPGTGATGSGPVPADQPAASQDGKSRLLLCVRNTMKEFLKTSLVMVPTGAIIIVLLDLGVQDASLSFLTPVLHRVGLPASSLIVFCASLVSQVAAISSTGTIAAKEGLAVIDCLLIFVLSRSIHRGIGSFRTGLPTNVAFFGKSLGTKVTLVDFASTQLGMMAAFLILIMLR